MADGGETLTLRDVAMFAKFCATTQNSRGFPERISPLPGFAVENPSPVALCGRHHHECEELIPD